MARDAARLLKREAHVLAQLTDVIDHALEGGYDARAIEMLGYAEFIAAAATKRCSAIADHIARR